ncbi:hypothetical protein ACWD2L_05910 [Streptomyces sp. NPDC002754]
MAVTFVASSRGPGSFPDSSNNTSSVASAKPAGTTVGDVLLAFCVSGGDAHHSAPAGWSTVSRYENVAGSLTSTIFYKVAGSSEASSYTFTDDEGGLTPMCVEILGYRGVDAAAPINVYTEANTAGTDTRSAPNATSTAAGKFIWFRAGRAATVSSEGAFTTSGGTARARTSNRGGSTQYFVQSVESSGGDKPVGTLAGASFNSSVTLTSSIERTVVLKTIGTPGTGAIASTLGKARASFAAVRTMASGPAKLFLPKVSADLVGMGAPPSGLFVFALPRLGESFSGTATGGPLSAGLPRVRSSFGGAVTPIGRFSSTLRPVTLDFLSETRPHGDNVIVVEDERRAFRVYAEDMTEIFRKGVVIDMTGPSGSLDTVMPRATAMFLDPRGNVGFLGMGLSPVRSSVGCSLDNRALLGAQLPRLRALLPGVSESANESSMSMSLPSLAGVDFEAYVAVTWVSHGGFVHGTEDLTVPLPASYQLNDVLLLAVTAEEGDTITSPEGWTQVNSSPQVTSSSDTGNQLAVFWRVSDGSEVPPVLLDGGDHLGAIIHAFHGCDIIDGPIDVDGGIFQEVNDTTATMPSLSTTIADEMVVYFGGHGVSTVSPEATLLSADADLANVTERSNDSTTDGAGGGLYVWTANCPPSTFVDSATFTLADPSVRTGIVVALLPLTVNGGLLATGGPIVSVLPGLTSSFEQGLAASFGATLPGLATSVAAGVIHGLVQCSLPRLVTDVEAALPSGVYGGVSTTLPAMGAAGVGEVDFFLKFDDSNYGFDTGVFK